MGSAVQAVPRTSIFRGVSAFPVTPQDDRGRVDAPALARTLVRLRDAGLGSVGLLGSTGSAVTLAREERRRAIEIAVETFGGTIPLLVGIGALRTDEAIRFGEDAREIGADAVLLAPVSYIPLNEDEVAVHCETVARTVGLPLCLYNNPVTTRFTFTPALIARLSRVVGIVAVKNPAGGEDATEDGITSLRRAAAPGFSVGWSVDAHAADALIAGGDAWYSVAAGLFPAPCVAIAAAAAAGDLGEARARNGRMRPLWNLFVEWSGYRVAHEAARLLGLTPHPAPLPILPLPAHAVERLADTIRGLELA